MTPEEREQLQRDLDAAGCPWLAEGAGQPLSTMSDDEREELRSLLRREERLRVMEAGVRAGERLMRVEMTGDYVGTYSALRVGDLVDRDREAVAAAATLLKSEVPDGQG